MKPAVNTVTLRAYTPEEVVAMLKERMIDAVEWAGDVHVPTGDLDIAGRVKQLCEENHIVSTSYASYYQCDLGGQGNGPFKADLGLTPALETAQALGVEAVRVWAGRMGSEVATSEYRDEVEDCMKILCDQANDRGMTVHLEFHRNTLTDTAASAVALIQAVGKRNLFSYWQPRHGQSIASNLADIEMLAPYLSHLHVFHWTLDESGTIVRHRLCDGKDRWEAYLEFIGKIQGERYAMIEFVKDNEIEQLQQDIVTLRGLINSAGHSPLV